MYRDVFLDALCGKRCLALHEMILSFNRSNQEEERIDKEAEDDQGEGVRMPARTTAAALCFLYLCGMEA